jgi:DNA helicase II / ATP-dependent DNA helicase PcrA
VLAYLKLLAAPKDEVALRRIINVPARGVGEKAIEALTAAAVEAGKPLWEVLPRARSIAGLSPAAHKGIHGIQALVAEFRERSERGSLAEVAADLIQRIDYQGELERNYPDTTERMARWSAVEEVINALATYEQRTKQPSLSNFLDETALSGQDDARDKESKLAKNAVALMTLHSAKGLEFPQVYLVGMEEGLLPHHRAVSEEGTAIDEERRLCYVGITRARDRLTLTLAQSRMKWGRSRPTIPSRFLGELLGDAENPSKKRSRPGGAKGASTARKGQPPSK